MQPIKFKVQKSAHGPTGYPLLHFERVQKLMTFKCTALFGCFLVGLALSAQQETPTPAPKPSKVKAMSGRTQTINASVEKNGNPHPGTAAIRGPATITCSRANSSIPGSTPKPSCFIQAPGVAQQVPVGGRVGSSGAGTVTLGCNGSGALTCTAVIQE